MKHIAYSHDRNRSLVETLITTIWRVLPGPFRSPNVQAGPALLRSRILVGIGWLIALAIQAALLVLIAELVEVIHGVMELYLDLVSVQLELQSTYIAATTPK